MFLGIERQPADRLAVVDNAGNRLTYGDLCDYARKIGSQVCARHLVFQLCKNEAGSLAGYLGMVDSGAVPLVLSNKIDKNLLNTLLETYTPAYLWIPTDMQGDFAFEPVYTALDYVLLKTGNEAYPIHDDLQFLMTTSGSTGSPKLVRYKKGNLEANAKNVALAFGWTAEERGICDLGMQYTMGLNVINSHLYAGATVLLTTHNLMSGDFWDYIKKEQGTNFTGVPFSYEIFARLRFQRMDLPYLTTLAEGGGKLTDKRYTELAEYAKNTGKRFIATFGTTETAARMAMLPAELALEKTGSIGRAIPNGELLLVDDEGNELPMDVSEGELAYRGPNVTMGYAVCKEDLAMGDVWKGQYRTGDLARRDADGCYYITGRKSRFLKLLSYRVSLDQCEQMIQQQFGMECACAGTDERMDIYVTDASVSGDVRSFISEKTGLFANLFKVIVVDSIPRNDSGKIAYKLLSNGDNQ